MLDHITTFLNDPHVWEILAPSLVAKGSSSTSTSETHVTTSTSFNPIISLGSGGDPVAPDTESTFAKALLAAPITVQLPKEPDQLDPKYTKGEPVSVPLLVAVGLVLWGKKRRG